MTAQVTGQETDPDAPYQVGELTYIKDDDPKFDTWQKAIDNATERSNKANHWDVQTFGIWSKDSYLEAIVYEGRAYTTE